LKKSFFLLIIVLFSFHGCSFKKDYTLFNQTSSFESPSSTIVDKRVRFEYKIMPNDRVSITVYQHPDLGTDTSKYRS